MAVGPWAQIVPLSDSPFAVQPAMPGGEAHSDYIALPSEGPGELYLEDEDGPFNSRKPPTCEFQTPRSSILVDLTMSHS